MADAPDSWEALRVALQEHYDSWAPGQQRIARLLLDDPQGTAFRPIVETARLADVHQSSVVRFAKSLGLDGYPALVALCRRQLADQAQLVDRFRRAEKQAESGDLLAATLEHEHHNLATTLSRVDPDAWRAAIDALAAADQIHVIGLRKCLPVAQLLAYLLRMVRSGVHQIAPVTGQLSDELRDLREGDVLVAVSIERYTAETVTALELARDRGLTTVAFTDSAASPLARMADIAFLVECEGVTVLRSIAAMVVLAQSLATAVAIRGGRRSRDELLQDEQMLERVGAYWEPVAD